MPVMMITFPIAVDKQVCGNCNMTLGIDKLSRNVVDINGNFTISGGELQNSAVQYRAL